MAKAIAITNMLCIAYFFLCQPCEYTAPTHAIDNTPFHHLDEQPLSPSCIKQMPLVMSTWPKPLL
jgi:hypothetical protein